MNWKFWQNKKARIAVPVAAAAVVVAAVGTVVAVNLTRPQAVTQEQARTIALEHAGVSAGEALSMQVSRDDGAYEVDFRTAGRSYEYKVGRSGQVLDYSYESTGTAGSPSAGESAGSQTSGEVDQQTQQAQRTESASGISQEEAEAIALEHAGVAEADASFYRVEQDRDDGRSVYEVEFTAGGTEYDYEIDSGTGEILSYDSDIEGWSLSSQSGAAVTLEQARELVVNRAKGLTAEDVRIREDWDDGRLVYEGEAWCNNQEHEFEIDAATGEFLSWSVENR